jgi:hypothetical protein
MEQQMDLNQCLHLHLINAVLSVAKLTVVATVAVEDVYASLINKKSTSLLVG